MREPTDLETYRRRRARKNHPAGKWLCMECGAFHNDETAHAAVCPDRGS